MEKYHISPSSGRANICRATKRGCPLGAETPHFESKEEANEYIAQKAKEEGKTFATITKKPRANDSTANTSERIRKQNLQNISERVTEANNRYEKLSKNVNILKDVINFGRTKFYPDFQNAVRQQRTAYLELERAVAQYKYVELGGNNFKNSLGITHPVGSVVTISQKPSTDLNEEKKQEPKKRIYGSL